MAQRKVAYAANHYTSAEGAHLIAHRGQVVELNAADTKRYDAVGATVKPDEELVLLGDLLPLNENASDVQITNYLLSGRIGEILSQVEGYPLALVDKLLVAEKTDHQRPQVIPALEKLLGKEPTVTLDTAPGSAPATTTAPPPVATPDPLIEGVLDAGTVVNGKVDDVLAYAAEHPGEIDALLAAESDGQNRTTLIEGLNKLKA